MNQYIKQKPARLKGKKLKELNNYIIQRDNNTCQSPYCKNGNPLDVPHHIQYKSRGGSDIACNLTTLCIYCHREIHYTATLKVTGAAPNNLTWEIIKK